MQKNIYPIFNPASEIIAIPFIISRFLKGKKIKDLLLEIIESTKKEALNGSFTEKDKYVKQIDYDNLDNFFATHFKAINNSKFHTFDEKIAYCLDKYAKESKSLLSVTNTVVLEENFLIGAKKTLSIYFILEKCNTEINEIENNIDITKINQIKPKKNEIIKKTEIEISAKETDFSVIKIDKVAPNLNHSEKFKDLFINKELFYEIDFTLLKDFNIIYNTNKDDLEFVSKRYRADIILLIYQLYQANIIRLDYGNKYLENIKDVFDELNLSIDNSRISKIFNKNHSKNDLENLQEIVLFISQFTQK